MTQDTKYAPVELIYKSRGLVARNTQDQLPPETYLNLLNCLERTEESISSRYGTQIINRDPAGTGTANHYFTAPVTSLARMTYLGQAYRYAGLGDGTLQRRTGNTQGAYTQIYSGLSGEPFGTVITNCFQSSQSYQFIYDENVSIKDLGTGTPQLTGIDPSPYTANTVPYSPLLTPIDNFASGNAYTSSGFSVAWTYTPITTLAATIGQQVTDFTEFLGVGSTAYTIAGGATAATATAPNSASSTNVYSGIASNPVTSAQIVTLSLISQLKVTPTTFGAGIGSTTLSYSIDGGASFIVFYAVSTGRGGIVNATPSVVLVGITDLVNLQVKVESDISVSAGSLVATSTISGVTATVATVGVFDEVTNGMLSVLNSNSTISVPIASIASSGLVGGIYQTLTVTTQTAHGLSGSPFISVYGTTNDLADGFYQATITGATTLTVPFFSAVQIGATGGVLYGGAAAPSTCVLTQEYSAPYPGQMTAWGFYQQVPTSTASFPIGSWAGTVAQNTTATVGVTTPINLNINNQATDDDLIVLTLNVGDPAAISNIRLQFDVNGSGYTSAYYYKDVAPSYYQQGVQGLQDAYTTTEQQIFADTLGLLTGQPPSSTTAQLQPSNISTGQNAWMTVYLRRGDFVPVGIAGQSGSDWAAATGWQIVFTTNTVGSSTVAVNGLYFQWGYGPSSFGGVGYDYRYTYYNANTGTESNGSPIQGFNKQFGYLASQVAPIFLRQAAQIAGLYSSDPQVTHLRMYRRGGTYSSNWFMIDQVPNITAGGGFFYKDVIPDAVLAQAPTLVLDNDPPVTSTLQSPIATTLSLPTVSPGSTIYSLFNPQIVTVAQSTAVFVPEQIVLVGYATTLEIARVITGGVGRFTAVLRLQHNAGEPVNVQSIPRQPCNLCALAYNQVWLGGDPNNPNYLYFSKPGRPESFGPQNYIPVGSSGDTINAVVNWRGTLFVATDKTWYSIVGGAQPYAQPTGSNHGVIAQQGWTQTESAIWSRAADGLREFTGGNNAYATLPVELIYRPNPTPPLTPVPLADPNQASQDVMAFYNNSVYTSYISTTNSGQRYRLNFDNNYRRFRNDDVPATAMLWEQDINTFLVGKQIGIGQYAVVQDQVGDYDDGGWVAGALVKTPITMVIQNGYQDLSKPHFPKQFNVLETDVNTQGQTMNTILLFDTEPPLSIVLDTANTGTERDKVQLKVNAGLGQQAYSMSIQHSMQVTVAPTLFQENIYAGILAAYRSSFDTYWIKFDSDASKLVKQCYFDYTSSAPITINIYADGSTTPYYTFTLPTNTARASVPMRVRFPARKLRMFRCVGTSGGDYQFWNNPVLEVKAIKVGTGYANYEFTV